jgi:hypothetical protein
MAYNGWTNYETWATALWIDNEPHTYAERRDLARRAFGVSQYADSLRTWIRDWAPDLGATLWADLLGAALAEVNWDEIAENWYAEEQGDVAAQATARANREDA